MSARFPILNSIPAGENDSLKLSAPQTACFSGNVALVTLGCAKNLVDSEVMLGTLNQKGFRQVADPSNADLIVVNTCAFLQSAVEESVERIVELAELKKQGRCRKLIVAGCLVERYRDQLAMSLPEVDRFISTDELLSVGDGSETTQECFDKARRPYFLYDETQPRTISTGTHTAFLKIAEGCDRPCSFCIIPKLRGRFRSRSIESVVEEYKHLHALGVKEFNLVAQDLTNYGADWTTSLKKPQLVKLLRALSEVTEPASKSWIRLLYAYPVGVTGELVNLIASTPQLCKYLDLPLQHISKNVLKRMRRPLGEKQTRALIEMIRLTAPNIALRTTFLTGFPGETVEDVDTLCSFISEGHFTHVGVFTYSQEEEADSYSYSEQIPDELKEERKHRIMTAQREVLEARNKCLPGKQIEVLIDGLHCETDLLLSARTEWQAPETDGEVIINDVEDHLLGKGEDIDREQLRGKFGLVEVTETQGYDLIGRLLKIMS